VGQPYLVSEAGEQFRVRPDFATRIGREPTNDIILGREPTVSGHHAIVSPSANAFWLHDSNSSNGTFVNGRPISDVELSDGDLIQFGTARFTFRDGIAGQVSATAAPHPAPQAVSIKRGSPHRSQPFITILAVLFLASGAFLTVLLRQAANQAWGINDSMKPTLFVSALVALASGYMLLRGFRNRCPSCRAWWQKKETGRQVIDRTLSNRVVNLRTDYYRTNESLPYRRSNRQGLKLMTIERHKCWNQCKSCGFQWITRETISD
jgi:hypothetical protein